jgi:hypothetical protein
MIATAIPEPFIPLGAASSAAAETMFTPFGLRAPSAAAASAKSAAPPSPEPASAGSSPGSDACGRPVITLQRTGDTVSSIRIQCTCGEIIDLSCVY